MMEGVASEAGSLAGHLGLDNLCWISAPLKELQKKFGFEPDQVVAAAKQLLGRNRPRQIAGLTGLSAEA